MASPTPKQRNWTALLVGAAGVLIALALPFAPVVAETTTVTWPAPGQPVASSTAIFAPYRPASLNASIPCSALRAADQDGSIAVLATGTAGDGLVVTARPGIAELRLDDRRLDLTVPAGVPDCRITIDSSSNGVTVVGADGRVNDMERQLVPEVFGFHTDLDATRAQGISVTARLASPFATTPTGLKIALVALQLVSVGLALVLLRRRKPRLPRFTWRRLWWIDIAVLAMLCGWAVIGPLSVDDGWATMIARNIASAGNPGNYYRWWDAAESPFAFSQQLLAPLTEISIAPLWLRLPSTVLAAATWFALSRGVLGAALPSVSATARVRIVAAVCLLVAWLPFNLGTRPESYVALGITTALALTLRIRTPAGLGWLALVVGLTIPISPNGILVGAPILVFAPRLISALRVNSRTRVELVANVILLCCVAALAITITFADQTWDGLVTATEWHTYFGPSLPWYREPDRYAYLLEASQQGSAAKRLPVLLSIAMLPVVAMLTVRRRDRDRVGGTAIRLGAVVIVSLLLLALTPSKWSYHLGAPAGLFAAFLTVSVVLLIGRTRVTPDRYVAVVGVIGSVLLAATAALAFDGPNAWWLPTAYEVPWAAGPIRPMGLPLNSPLLWGGLAVLFVAVAGLRRRRHFPQTAVRALVAGPALLTITACGTILVLLTGSFVAAPFRRQAGSVAQANLGRVTGQMVCGLADDIEVLPDGEDLTSAESAGEMTGFTAQRGYYPGAPPPDPVGTGASTLVWGSRATGLETVGSVTTRWFVLPRLAANGGVAISVSGRTTDGNELAFEFGHARDGGVDMLGERAPIDRTAPDEDPAKPTWRTIGVDAAEVPADADRVRIRAVDGRPDDFGWLAFTGPRLRSVVGLTSFLAANGPVLIAWPQGFLFPCVRNIAQISNGVAQTPRTVIESPRPWSPADRQSELGGTFVALAIFGHLREVPSRLIGHPGVDWGSVLVSGDDAARDAYQLSVGRSVVPGAGGVRRQHPQE